MNLFTQKVKVSVAIFLLCLSTANVKSFPADNQADEGDGDYEVVEEVEAADEPEFISTSQRMEAAVGEELILPCQVNKLEGFLMIWSVSYSGARKEDNPQVLFLGGNKQFGPDKIELEGISEGDEQQGSTLTIKDLSLSDSGTYICTVATAKPITLEFDVKVLQSKNDFQIDANKEQDTLTNPSTSDASSHFINVPMVLSLTLLRLVRW